MNVCSGNEALVLLARQVFPDEEIFALLLPMEGGRRIIRCVRILPKLPEQLAASFGQPDPRRVPLYNGGGRISGEVELAPGGDVCDIVTSWAEALKLDHIPTLELVVSDNRGTWRVLCDESPAEGRRGLGEFAFLV